MCIGQLRQRGEQGRIQAIFVKQKSYHNRNTNAPWGKQHGGGIYRVVAGRMISCVCDDGILMSGN